MLIETKTQIAVKKLVQILFFFLLMTQINFAQWVQINGPSYVFALATSGINIFAASADNGIFLSTNNGNSWTAVNSGLTDPSVIALALSGRNLFAGSFDKGVFLSTNNGASWMAVNSGLTCYCTTLGVSDTNLFAGTYSCGVFLSTNNGTSWTVVDSGLTNLDVKALVVSGTNIFAAAADNFWGGDSPYGVFRSTNNGTSWTAVNNGLPNSEVMALGISGTNIFARTAGNGVFLTTNNGANWIDAKAPFSSFSQMLEVGTNLFAGTDRGVFLSTNNGTSWTAVNNGLADTEVTALGISGTNIFAGTWGRGVWRRPISEMITNVDNEQLLPAKFTLSQNYPNPFNPTTIIKYSVSKQSYVTLKVYDILGREVATLVNEEKPAGNYNVRINVSQDSSPDIASGVYFYQLTAGDYVCTKKMILLK